MVNVLEVNKVAYMVADMEVNKVADMVADEVADMEVDKVAEKVSDKKEKEKALLIDHLTVSKKAYIVCCSSMLLFLTSILKTI